MKYFLAFFAMLIHSIFIDAQKKSSADQTLEKVYEKLNDLKSINYDLTRELNYPSANYQAISKWNCFYLFDSKDNAIGFQFQIDNSDASYIFNGAEFFSLNKEDKTLEINNLPKKESFSSDSYFYNSMITLRNILPSVINDKNIQKTISDTLINGKLFQMLQMNLGKRRIRYLGDGFDKMTTKENFIYKIIIDSDNYLPKEILQTNDLNTDFIKTDFENIRVNPEMPKENTWYYPSYQNEYHLAKKQNDLPVLSAGSIAPEWKLKLLNEDKTLSSNDLKGKVILLDFWIKNCNGCIESIPYLKNIQEKYKNDDFVLISINSYDSVEKLNWFSEKYQLNYPVLINGKSVADKYGVYAFPTIFVIDKTGKIIYNDGAGADEDKIEAILKKALGK